MTYMRQSRLLAETSLHVLARQVGLDASEISRIERRLIDPTPRMVSALEEHFGVSIGHLLAEAAVPKAT